jgi:hypothetical protein
MYYVGWMVAIMSLGILLGPESRLSVAVLLAGPVLLLLIIRGTLPSLPRPGPPSGPRSIDIEAQHIRDLQASDDERARDEH